MLPEFGREFGRGDPGVILRRRSNRDRSRRPENRHPHAPLAQGVSGNPGGRVRLARAPSAALAELNDTPGDSIQEIVENFKAARKRAGGLVAADHKALAMFQAESDPERRSHVAAFEAVTDRLEGKVAQRQEASLTIRVVPYRFVGASELCASAPELLEAEVVEEGEK